MGIAEATYDGHRIVNVTAKLLQSGPVAGPVATARRITAMVRNAVPAGERVTCSDPACGYTRTEKPSDIVVALVEQPIPGVGTARSGELHALYLHLIRVLDLRGIPVATTLPVYLKQWATGKGNATKAEMKMALDRLHPGVMTRSQHDRADAEHPVDGALAALAASAWLGWFTGGEPLRQAQHLGKMTWPKLPEQRPVPAVTT